LHSCYGVDYIRRQPIGVIKRLLKAAKYKEDEDAAWDVWLMKFLANRFLGGEIKPFDEYIKGAKEIQTITNEEYDDIIKKAEESKERHQLSMLKRVK
jgi:hypothetical protein